MKQNFATHQRHPKPQLRRELMSMPSLPLIGTLLSSRPDIFQYPMTFPPSLLGDFALSILSVSIGHLDPLSAACLDRAGRSKLVEASLSPTTFSVVVSCPCASMCSIVSLLLLSHPLCASSGHQHQLRSAKLRDCIREVAI